MSLEKKVSLKKVLYFSIALTLISCLTTGALVYAFSPGNYQAIAGGAYPGASAYTIFGDDGTYYAKNQYGQIVYSGTDAATVINDAIEACNTLYTASGSANTYTVKLLGYIGISSTICVLPGVSLDFDTIKILESNVDGITYNGTGGTTPDTINGKYIMFKNGFSETAITLFNAQNVKVNIDEIYPTSGYGTTASAGIKLIGEASKGNYYNKITFGFIIGVGTGIKLDAEGTAYTSYVNSNSFYGGTVDMSTAASLYGVRLTSSGGGEVSGNSFYSITVQGPDSSMTGFALDGSYPNGQQNNFYYCSTVDSAASSDVAVTGANTGSMTFIGGQLDHGAFYEAGQGSIILEGVHKYSARGTATIISSYYVDIDTGLKKAPTLFFASFNNKTYGSYQWANNGTVAFVSLSIPSANSGTYSVSWYAEYQP